MHGKASQKLNSIQCNWLFNSSIPVIFGDEFDFAIGDVQNALVCDGYPMGVLAECEQKLGFPTFSQLGFPR